MPNEPVGNWTWRVCHFAIGAVGVETFGLLHCRWPLLFSALFGLVVTLCCAGIKEYAVDTFGEEHDGWGLSNPDGTDASTADFLGYTIGAIVALVFISIIG